MNILALIELYYRADPKRKRRALMKAAFFLPSLLLSYPPIKALKIAPK